MFHIRAFRCSIVRCFKNAKDIRLVYKKLLMPGQECGVFVAEYKLKYS